MKRAVTFLSQLFILQVAQGQISSHKPLPHRFLGEGGNEEFFKGLEYAANHKGPGGIPEGLNTIDFNLIEDDDFAWEISEGVDAGLNPIDQQIDHGRLATGDNAHPDSLSKENGISLMHRGSYVPSPQYNQYIDDLIVNIRRDIRRRKLDSIYFTVHKRGVVRHAPKGHLTRDGQLVEEDGTPAASLQGKRNRTGVIGGGHIEGLRRIRRFGNAESREERNKYLLRSHYFFGPLNVDLVFRVTNGLREINSTLRSLAAHALFELDEATNTTKLLEFIIDSPLEYEVELRGTRNKKLRRLSQAAMLRLFKRDGRMQRRLNRCFSRATQKPITSKKKNSNTDQKKTKYQNPDAVKPIKLVSYDTPRL